MKGPLVGALLVALGAAPTGALAVRAPPLEVVQAETLC